MTKIIQLAALSLAAFLIAVSGAAQTQQARTKGYYTFGINGGLSYQQSDVLTDKGGFGLGVTYGKNFIYTPGTPFSVDVRSRFQLARSFGKDIRPTIGIELNQALNGEKSLDYTSEAAGNLIYANHKTDLVELGVEGVITLNGLREKTGLSLSVTGGVGLDWYKTTIDQRNANGLYSEQYKNLAPNASRSYAIAQLDGFRDEKYETMADGFDNSFGKLGIMPSLGLELDYDLTSNLALGIGHRVSFSGTDVLDGQRWTNTNALTGNNDLLHYSSLGLKYTFNKKKKPLSSPSIELIEPYGNDLRTQEKYATIKAKIKRVSNPFDVYLSVNGVDQRFNFNNQTLVGRVSLQEGQNRISIHATNKEGQDQETFFLFYEPIPQLPIAPVSAPEINFADPPYDGFKTEAAQMKIQANIGHIDNWKAIELRINGKKKSFDFDARIGSLEALIDLRVGKNIIEVKAKNKGGEKRAQRTIFYERPLPFPQVQFIKPARHQSTVESERINIEVSLKNVLQSADIQLYVNGRAVSGFYFDQRSDRLRATVLLRAGRNEIELVAANRRGQGRDKIEVFFQPLYIPRIAAPVIRINAPKYGQSTTREEWVTVHATLQNVFRKSAILFTNNGRRIDNFQFDPNSFALTHRLYLQPGINHIVIEAQNESGINKARATINFEPFFSPPPIIAAPVVSFPEIDIRRPQNHAVFTKSAISVRANIAGINFKDDIVFNVNREDCLDFDFNPQTGRFSATAPLKEGKNTIILKTANPAGADRKKITVFYKKPYPPEIRINTPDYTSTPNRKIVLKAEIKHIESKQDLALRLNDRVIRDFRFKEAHLEATLVLQEGKNRVEIFVENDYGSDQKIIEISYNIPKPPMITITKPANKQTVETKQIQLEARLKNVKERKAIRLFINGRASGNFEFDGAQLTATIHLKEGRNSLILKAKTAHGVAEVNLQIDYKKPKIFQRPTLSKKRKKLSEF